MTQQELNVVLEKHVNWMYKAGGQWAKFEGEDFTGLDFKYARLANAVFKNCNFTNADFRYACLKYAVLNDCNFTNVNFHSANLRKTKFFNANLKNANFETSEIRDADLTEAYFEYASFEYADFSNNKIKGIKFSEDLLSQVPKIENIHRVVYENASKPDALDMGNWHTCKTTHCRAGWVTHLAGENGQLLEEKYGTSATAALIYIVSDPNLECIPDFHESENDALADMKRLAEHS